MKNFHFRKYLSIFVLAVMTLLTAITPAYADPNPENVIESMPGFLTTYGVNSQLLPKHSGAFSVGVTLDVQMQLTGNPSYWNYKTYDSELYKYGYNLFWNSKTGDTYSFKGTDAKAVLYWYNTGFTEIPEYDRYILVYLYNYYGHWTSVDAGYYNSANNTYYNETVSVPFKSGTYTYALIPANNLTDPYGTAIRFNGGNWDISGTLPNNSNLPGSLWLAYSVQTLYVPSDTDVTDLLAEINRKLGTPEELADDKTGADNATDNFNDKANEYIGIEDGYISDFSTQNEGIQGTFTSFSFGSITNARNFLSTQLQWFYDNSGTFRIMYIFPMMLGLAMFFIRKKGE